MRAYVYNSLPTGEPILGSGLITGEYKTEANLLRYGVEPIYRKRQRPLIVQLFYSWDNRYGKPDRQFVYLGKKVP